MWSEPAARRRFLRYLLASPLLGQVAGVRTVLGQDSDETIGSPELALDVMDFEVAARKALPPAHFGYLQTGVDDDATLRANREAFTRVRLRVRRLVGVQQVDTSVSLFGTTWNSPVVLAPVGSQRAFHPEAELAVARAARTREQLMVLSTVATSSVEDVTAARGEPIWYQLYPTDQWPITKALVQRALAAGCPALVLTVDLQGGTNRVTLERSIRRDRRDCASCHGDSLRSFASYIGRKPMFAGLDVSQATDLTSFEMSWDDVKRLRELWPRKLLIKGIVRRDDAELAVKSGVDGLVVSNHGGRAEESGRATIDSLVEVVDGVKGRVPVLVDGGFRRGTDVFKALALGATAVCIGRPYVWGLAAFGQAGVERVLEILRRELVMVMRQAGTRRIAEIDASYVVRASS